MVGTCHHVRNVPSCSNHAMMFETCHHIRNMSRCRLKTNPLIRNWPTLPNVTPYVNYLMWHRPAPPEYNSWHPYDDSLLRGWPTLLNMNPYITRSLLWGWRTVAKITSGDDSMIRGRPTLPDINHQYDPRIWGWLSRPSITLDYDPRITRSRTLPNMTSQYMSHMKLTNPP